MLDITLKSRNEKKIRFYLSLLYFVVVVVVEIDFFFIVRFETKVLIYRYQETVFKNR